MGKSKLIISEPIEAVETVNGVSVYHTNATVASDDWLRAGRLKDKIKAGGAGAESAQKELTKMENTKMIEVNLETEK